MLSVRVVIPIHDEQGQWVAYAGRSVDGRAPRVAARLRNRCEVGVIQLPEGEQPDQLPERELRQLIERAMRS